MSSSKERIEKVRARGREFDRRKCQCAEEVGRFCCSLVEESEVAREGRLGDYFKLC